MARLGRGQSFKPKTSRVFFNGNILFDAVANSGLQVAQSAYTFDRTLTGNNRYLAVDIALLSAGQTVSSVVDDSTGSAVPLVFIGARTTVTSFGRIESWGLANPAYGTKTIAVTLTGSATSVGLAVSYTGVQQTTPTEAFNSAQATNVGAADAIVQVTPITDNTWLHAAVATDDGSITAGQTSRNNVSGGATLSGANEDTGPITPAAATNLSYTNIAALATWAIGGYAIRPLSAGAATFSITPGVGGLSIFGVAARNDIGLIGTVGSLVLTGVAPISVLGTQLTTVVGGLAISGVAPRNDLAIITTAGALVLTGAVPTLTVPGATSITPDAGTLALLGFNVLQNLGLISTVGSLTLSGVAPANVQGRLITPAVGALALTGVAGRMDLALITTVGALTLAGGVPTLTIPGSTNITPSVGVLTMAGTTSVMNFGQITTVGTLTVSGVALARVTGFVLIPSTGTTSISGAAPRWNLGIYPVTGSLSITSLIVLGTEITPTCGVLALIGGSPEAVMFLSPSSRSLFILDRKTDRFVI